MQKPGLRSTQDQLGIGIALDAANNVYTAGTFEGTVDFDPGAGNSHELHRAQAAGAEGSARVRTECYGENDRRNGRHPPRLGHPG